MTDPSAPLQFNADDIVDTVRDPMLVMGADLRVLRVNRSFCRTFHVAPEESLGRLVYDLGNRQWDIPALRRLLETVLPQETAFDDFEVVHDFQGIGRKVMLLNARRVARAGAAGRFILLTIEDITERRRLEDERQELETRFTSLVKNIKDHSIFTLDTRGAITSWNREAENIFGYSEAESLGQLFNILFTPDDQRDGIPALELRTALSEGRAEVERWHMRKGGEHFWALGIVTPTHDASGNHTGFSKILRDMTDRKRAQEQLRLQAELMDHVGEAVIVTDLAGTITHWNAFAERLYGWSKAETLGRNILDVTVSEDAVQPADEIMHTLRKGESWSGEFTVRRRDGTTFPAHVTTTPMLNAAQEVVGVVGVSADISERTRAETAFGESEQRFRALMEQAPFSIQVFSPDGRTIRVNRAWEHLWGATLEQLSDYNILNDSQLEQKGVLECIRRGFAGESALIPAIHYDPNETLPDRTRHEDPSRWVAAIIYPLKDTSGIIREVVLVHDDVTARKRVEEALHATHREMEERIAERTAELARTNEFLQALLENVQDGIVACDAQGVLTLFNHVTRQLHGLPEAPIPAGEWAERYRLYHSDGSTPMTKEDVPLFRALQGERVHDVEMVIIPDHLQPRTVLTSGQAFFDADGEKLGAVVSMHDITQRKQAEHALRQAHAELERRVHDRTVELAHANDALLDADRRKDEFLATLAHELRNPLAPIRNALQILSVPRVDAVTAMRSREMIERQVHHLVRLVDDLLDVSRVMRDKIELRKERVELASIIARAVETVQPLVDAQAHQLTIHVPPESLAVDVDPVRMAQVVSNLLTNAAKYTEAEGRLRLSVERDGGLAVLRVVDNGIGIAPAMLHRIFDLFVQADHTSTKAQGELGIGLTLVKNLVEMHSGTVEVHSEGLGQGSEFIVRLPIAAPIRHEDQTGSGQSVQPLKASGHRVLVVDDNQDAAESLAMLFTLQGHEVRTAYSGAAALEVTSTYRPDVVFLDIGMPGLDGHEVARRMRQQPGLEAVMLVALTGWGQQEDRRRTTEAGFNHHLVKPPAPRAIDAVLAELSQRGEADRTP